KQRLEVWVFLLQAIELLVLPARAQVIVLNGLEMKLRVLSVVSPAHTTKAIDDVREDVGINVVYFKLAIPLSVLRPIGEVANYLLAYALPFDTLDVTPSRLHLTDATCRREQSRCREHGRSTESEVSSIHGHSSQEMGVVRSHSARHVPSLSPRPSPSEHQYGTSMPSGETTHAVPLLPGSCAFFLAFGRSCWGPREDPAASDPYE